MASACEGGDQPSPLLRDLPTVGVQSVCSLEILKLGLHGEKLSPSDHLLTVEHVKHKTFMHPVCFVTVLEIQDSKASPAQILLSEGHLENYNFFDQ